MKFDFVVIGGSFAGLSAALSLARARRQVLVVDAGQRRNQCVDAAGHGSHGFLTQDGRPPAEIAAEGKRQLMRYPSVQWLDGLAENARLAPDGRIEFEVATRTISAGRLILATGVRDELPAVPGLAERWGRSVFHCPYCHGYELNEGRIGIIAGTPMAMHQGLMLPDWGSPTLFLNGVFTPTHDERAQLQRRGTQIEATPIQRIDAEADVVLSDGRVLRMDGLFTQSRIHMQSPLAAQLGCEFSEGPLGPFIKVGATQATSVPGVFACGDAARAASNVAIPVADGAIAGLGAHQAALAASA